MSVQVRYRREAASFLASFVGAQGELLIDTTNNRVQVHDGATPGGFPAAKLSEVLTNTRTQVADANYTALASDRNIAVTGLTAARTITLPAAATYPTGTQLVVFDESGACSASNAITITRVGTDTINGATSAAIQTSYGYLALETNGAGKWTIVDSPAIAGVTSVAGRTGAVTLAVSDVSGAASTSALAGKAASGANTDITSLGGLTTALSVGQGGTGAGTVGGARSSLGAAASGANADITSLSGLTAPLSIAQGGSGTSRSRTAVADANYTVVTADRLVAYTALTAARTVTLPAASAYSAGIALFVVDESGACSSTNTITVARAGSDTINGAASATISTSNGYLAFESDGSSKWTVIDQAVVTAGIKNNFAATTDPTSANDTSAGYSAGSFWLRTDTGDLWRCRSAAAGAAVWLRLDQADFYGYVAGNTYLPSMYQATSTGSTLSSARISFMPFEIKQRCTITSLGLLITAASAGGNIQVALYASGIATKLPTGPALVSTASMSTASATTVSAAISLQLDPGLYWLAINTDTAGQSATYQIFNNTAPFFKGTIGGVAAALNTDVYVVYSVAFGTWPDMTSNTVSIGISTLSYMPAVNFKVGSIP